MHSIKEPRLERISQIFRGKGVKTNKEILQVLAFEGPKTPYDLFKSLSKKSGYPVVNRRIRALAKDGHVYVVGSQPAQKSKQKIKRYGLTVRGFVLSLLFIDYDDKVKEMLTANSGNIVFCRYFSEAIEKKRLTCGTVKTIFLDNLKMFAHLGWYSIDVIPDYFLFKHTRDYILHFSQKRIDELPEETRGLVANILFDFRRFAHPETTLTFLQKYLDEEPHFMPSMTERK